MVEIEETEGEDHVFHLYNFGLREGPIFDQ